MEWHTEALIQPWMAFYRETGPETGVLITVTIPQSVGRDGKLILGPFTGYTISRCSFLTDMKVSALIVDC